MGVVSETAPMPIKWKLKAVLADRELEVADLVERTGLHRVTVSKLVNRFAMPDRLTPATLEKLCKALKCEPGDLLKFEE